MLVEPLEDRRVLASTLSGLDYWPEADPDITASLLQRAEAGEVLRVIVQASDTTAGVTLSAHAGEHGAAIVHQFERFPLALMEVDLKALQGMLNSPWMVSVVEDGLLAPTLNGSLPVINAPQVHNLDWDGSGVAVAILDTGIDRNHPFFGDRVVEEACFSNSGGSGEGVSLCPSGESSETGVGAANSSSSGCLNGSNNMCTHGPHVAGIAAGDGTGVSGAPAAGVAPGAGIIAVQVFTRYNTSDQCGTSAPCLRASFSDLIRGLEHVLQLSDQYTVAAVNMSLGGNTYSTTCDAAHPPTTLAIDNLLAANIATVVASGNAGRTNAISIPACISSAISVGSTNNSDSVAGSSNRGPLLDLFAPGVGIRSAVANNGYGNKSGTSMAAPHVAGAWAVLRQMKPALSVSEALTLLQETGKPISYSSGGSNITTPRIDLLAAVETAFDYGEIRGFKWHDINGNGVWDEGEPPLEGWQIYLDLNNNGQWDDGEPITVTGAEGSYSFTGLQPGSYTVAEVMQEGWEQTAGGPERLFAVRGTSNEVPMIYEIDTSGGVLNSFGAPGPVPVIGPQGLAFDGRSLFYIDGNDTGPHTLYELHPTTGAVINETVLPSTNGIAGAAYLDGYVYLEAHPNNQILVFDPGTSTVVSTLNVPADLMGGLTGAADLGLLFDSNFDGLIFAIDPATGDDLYTLNPEVGPPFGGLAYFQGELIASAYDPSPTAYRIHAVTGAVLGSFAVGGTGSLLGLAGDGVSSETHTVSLGPGQIVEDINFGNRLKPAPRVTGAYVRGDDWNQRYLDMLETNGLGSALGGFKLIDGTSQLANSSVVSWETVDQVAIGFDMDVSVAADALRVYGVIDGSGESILQPVTGFVYDQDLQMAMWTLEAPLVRGKFVLALDASKVTGNGLALDGEWQTSVSSYPSGDGQAGGDFHFRFNYLPGDVNGSGRTDQLDWAQVRNTGVRFPDATNFRFDYDASNRIDQLDWAKIRNLGILLLAGFGEPSVPESSSGSGAQAMWDEPFQEMGGGTWGWTAGDLNGSSDRAAGPNPVGSVESADPDKWIEPTVAQQPSSLHDLILNRIGSRDEAEEMEERLEQIVGLLSSSDGSRGI